MKTSKTLTTALLAALTLLPAGAQRVRVKTGIEVLKEQHFSLLEGKRVGLITNPTGVDSDLRLTADILHEAPNVQLVALYAPEHGIRGEGTRRGAGGRPARPPHRAARAFAARQAPQAHAGHAARRGRAGVRHPGHRMPLVHLRQHLGAGHAGRRRMRHRVHGAGPPQPAGRAQRWKAGRWRRASARS